MSTVEDLHPDGSDFDRFLYAPVGEDHNGSVVTVVSAFARLGLDPWKEAADLALLGRDAARVRLSTLLSGFKDVPTLDAEHRAVAARLTLLLPERLTQRVSKLAMPKKITATPAFPGKIMFVAVLAVVLLAWAYFLGNTG